MKHIVITIGREYGSGGRLIAQRLAEELGVTFYDKQLIAEVAKRTGFSEHFVRDAEHQRPTNSFLYDLYCAVQTPSVPDQMFIAQAKVIKEAAARESCVIVGRCADYILREEPYCLKTFVYAPLEQRVPERRTTWSSPIWRAMYCGRTRPALPITIILPPGGGGTAGSTICASTAASALTQRWRS